ncbi:MAG: isoleucine--tRNA ligase [Deltaproteobacteria bacterium]|nr:isoleucine--tRNA ligase [Deltaproteobacteria bacterium]
MKAVTSDVNFPQMETELLAEWQERNTFAESMSQRRGSKEFTFYDGPPFANGLPHYGHLLANTIKDTVPRYWTMRGYYVDRRFGWDCHGVPVEYEIEKRDNLKGRADILAMGVDKFNEACRASVQAYTVEWERTITRLGRWVDWQNQYRTMDKSFMESVWWVLSELYKRGLVYRDFKVVPYSPRITAVLSNFEANQNYKDVQDPAITVKFKLKDEDAFILAWTTTPWTLISNLALCVGSKIQYVKVRDHESGEHYYLAEARLASLYKKGGKDAGAQPFDVVAHISASQLAGKHYEPLFPYFKEHPGAFRILVDDYVTTDDGTGVVHQAPAYGEDDFRVCRAHGITLVDPVDEEGRFKSEIADYAGSFVKDADKEIIRRLRDSKQLLRNEQLLHSYPFCERTDTPLIYKAIQTWYVAVEKIKDRLIANNQRINWVPEHLRDGRMGKWLENARDWAISRNRFWGTPIPIWICSEHSDHMEVMSSVADLEARTKTKVDDLHIHHIDRLTFACQKCAGQMRRIPEVFDCWFESGSMPYAQIHYPFEHKDRFHQRFPADFIAEGLDQTRGWFYTLSVLSTALFNEPAFKNVVVNGMVLAEDGKKMSKRLKNYTPPETLLGRFGADSVRLFMLNSAVLKAGDLCFSDQGVRDTTRAVLLPLWNAHSFLTTYAVADHWQPSKELASGVVPAVDSEIDRWIISRFHTLCQRVHEQMHHYRLYNVVPQVLDFIEDLTNWYIRLSRKRFWGTDDESTTATNVSAADTEQAYQTLYYVLLGFSKVFAPFAPFIADRIYKNLTAGFEALPESVHLCDIPLGDKELIDRELEGRMDLLRRASNLGRSLRAKHQIKTRQVLPSMLVITRKSADRDAIERGAELLRGELNIKEVLFSTDEANFVLLSLKPNLKTLGPRIGKELNAMRQHLEQLNKEPQRVVELLTHLEEQGSVKVLGHDLTEADFLIDRGPKDGRLIATEHGVTVLLDTKLTPELVQEGLARELINRIQRLRKDSGLQVSDRIVLRIAAELTLAAAARAFAEYIKRETLATELEVSTCEKRESTETAVVEIDGSSCSLVLAVARS